MGVHEEEKKISIEHSFILNTKKKKKTEIIYRTLVSLYFVSGPWFQMATIVFQLYFNYNILHKKKHEAWPTERRFETFK